MVRRARLIPFLAKFVDHPRLPHERKRDRLIEEKLKGESDGIMTKLCHRAFDIVQEGRLKPPSQDTLRATKAWFNEIDPIKAFIDECVEYVPEKRVSTRELWEAFRTFCLINNERSALTQRAFVERIKTKLEKECHRVQYKGEKQFVFDGMKLSEKALQDNRGEF
jgi:phage/plasmid-associated DNA primase